jgi:glyoxylase-like metal-dependent hydrolase (beta-lactamase superfamily II)
MGDHILVVESGQSDTRGMAVMAAAKQAIPNKPIRFVVNSHPHFDHASGLAAAVAEGATLLTHQQQRGCPGEAAVGAAHVDRRQPFEGQQSSYERS